MTNPSRIVHGKFECDMFYGDPADLLFEQLKGIFNHGNRKNVQKDETRGKNEVGNVKKARGRKK